MKKGEVKPNQPKRDLEEFFALLRGLRGAWKELAATLVPGLASILAAFQIGGRLAYACSAAIVGAVGVAGFLIFRYRRKRIRTGVAGGEAATTGPDRRAIRGALPFAQYDRLPGERRRGDAVRIATQASLPDFRLAIVYGASGCGKSSLLRSHGYACLEKAGFSVCLVTNPLELAGDRGTDPKLALDGIERMVAEAGGAKPVVLIVDQFEELLNRYPKPEARRKIGKAIDGFGRAGRRVRTLCVIRKEFFLDLKSLDLARPLSTADTIEIDNFEIDEAAQIVKECAEADGVKLDPAFPGTLSEDLAYEGKVRPVELQLVCDALRGDLTVKAYREAGGAAGLLSRHITRALELSDDAPLGRRIFRTLGDLGKNVKEPPKTVAELVDQVPKGSGGSSKTLNEDITSLLERLEQERLVTRTGEPPRWSLVHDYLVEPIKLATQDETTAREEANSALRYYVSEFVRGAKLWVPPPLMPVGFVP
ncbi:MAG TPA: hypothetical protein VKI44_07130 [Acetobacteraceae bacterium]|nr:hypothetical protein [Acetobacteraceae bacterium]